MHAMTRFLTPLLLAATLAALRVAHSARSAPETGTGHGSELPLANGTAPGLGPNPGGPATNARHLQEYTRTISSYAINVQEWCPNGADPYGCNLLGYDPFDVPVETTTRISMVGGVGGGPGHVWNCNTSSTPRSKPKHVTMIQIYTDQLDHRNFNFIDQITVTWNDSSITRIGSCRCRITDHCTRGDCETVMKRSSDKYVIDTSGERVVRSYQMAVDGHNATNPGDGGQLLGALFMNMKINDPSIDDFSEVQGYKSCNGCAGDEYEISEPRVGNGKICGITYRSGYSVDAFGLVFYDNV